ncbi:uncharacterized protein LOC131856620 [Cryptomeria japonica]|uniref:uncharacterized protein LOC131856620 n=1 Tax=Cryptomeria japonica TaxID=3369 RepID=UPI0027D9F569|nr:uncharacterized protein LOC131856620 [Cryptomeria japonica]
MAIAITQHLMRVDQGNNANQGNNGNQGNNTNQGNNANQGGGQGNGGKASARTWVQKLNTYFQLNPMLEEDAIKYAALHLDGSANEWWHHERRLIVLFVDGLSEPLHGWVKGHDPLTLQDANRKARDLAPSASRSKFTPKDPHFKKDKDKKPLHKDSQPQKKESKRLDDETLNELRQKKICF